MSTPNASERRNVQDIIAKALSLVKEGRQFPGNIYTSPEMYELEKERMRLGMARFKVA